VIEQAPPDIDEYIQPSDSALLLSSLKSLSVSRFELEPPASVGNRKGDPRNVAIRFEFGPNEYFSDTVLEKRFWHRHSADGAAGLVSEPVDIAWKKGRDLTGGLLGMVKRVWDEEQAGRAANGNDKKQQQKSIKKKEQAEDDDSHLTAEQKALQKKIAATGLGGVSFFAWFGYIGRHVSAEESRTVCEKEAEKRRLRKEGKEVEDDDEQEEEEDEEAGEDEDTSLEIFSDGEDLAMAIAEDLWPNAIKYFGECDDMSFPWRPYACSPKTHQSVVRPRHNHSSHGGCPEQCKLRSRTP